MDQGRPPRSSAAQGGPLKRYQDRWRNMLSMLGRQIIRYIARIPLVSAPLFITLFICLTGFDLTRHNVPPGEILDGGPPKDGIPAILQPKFVSASDALF